MWESYRMRLVQVFLVELGCEDNMNRAIKGVEPPVLVKVTWILRQKKESWHLSWLWLKRLQTPNDKPPNSIIRGGLNLCLICCGDFYLSKPQYPTHLRFLSFTQYLLPCMEHCLLHSCSFSIHVDTFFSLFKSIYQNKSYIWN